MAIIFAVDVPFGVNLLKIDANSVRDCPFVRTPFQQLLIILQKACTNFAKCVGDIHSVCLTVPLGQTEFGVCEMVHGKHDCINPMVVNVSLGSVRLFIQVD